MVSKLDELENKENDGTITDEEKDVSLPCLALLCLVLSFDVSWFGCPVASTPLGSKG